MMWPKNQVLVTLLKISLLILTLAGCGGGTTGTDTGGSTKVIGLVLETNGQAIPNATVSIEETGDHGVTDASGQFEFESDLPSDTVTFLVETEGVQARAAVQGVPSTPKELNVTLEVNRNENEVNVTHSTVTARPTPTVTPITSPQPTLVPGALPTAVVAPTVTAAPTVVGGPTALPASTPTAAPTGNTGSNFFTPTPTAVPSSVPHANDPILVTMFLTGLTTQAQQIDLPGAISESVQAGYSFNARIPRGTSSFTINVTTNLGRTRFDMSGIPADTTALSFAANFSTQNSGPGGTPEITASPSSKFIQPAELLFPQLTVSPPVITPPSATPIPTATPFNGVVIRGSLTIQQNNPQHNLSYYGLYLTTSNVASYEDFDFVTGAYSLTIPGSNVPSSIVLSAVVPSEGTVSITIPNVPASNALIDVPLVLTYSNTAPRLQLQASSITIRPLH